MMIKVKVEWINLNTGEKFIHKAKDGGVKYLAKSTSDS